jgi:hypothetical protein
MRKCNTTKNTNSKIFEVIKIKPLWAIGKNVKYLLDKTLDPKNGRFVFKMVKTERLVKCSDFYEIDMNSLYTGDETNDYRVSRILDCWGKGKYLDPPTIYIDRNTNKVVYNDGRHRVKVSYLLKIEKIPVALDREDLTIINLLLDQQESKIIASKT